MQTFKFISAFCLLAFISSCETESQNSSSEGRARLRAISQNSAPAKSFSDAAAYPSSPRHPQAAEIVSTHRNSDVYAETQENDFTSTGKQSVSTFSIDADGASFSNVRRFIRQENKLPPPGAIRVEELINYFDLHYQYVDTRHPINVNGEVSQCPWNLSNKLVRIGIKGKTMDKEELPASNFVFLIDVSGSMGGEDKLELLKNGFKYFVDEMSDKDRIAIVTYAGTAGVALSSTSGKDKAIIKSAINRLGAGGSTAGAAGILTAYEIAERNFIEGGNNRIILGTDGDFNVGISNREQLIKLVEAKRKNGVYVTVLGVGRGNLNDAALEQIANKGNGTYEYIDHIEQLRKVFIYDYGKFFTVAKDVKVQVEFNPARIASYRLVGYENRALNKADFDDDKKDAGEIGANQDITALYEVVPVKAPKLDSGLALTVKLRYKKSINAESIPLSYKVYDGNKSFHESSNQMKFVSSAASFAMVLSNSEYKGDSNYSKILAWLESSKLPDERGFKKEFSGIVEAASRL